MAARKTVPISFRVEETLSSEALRSALGENGTDILVLSAHGFFDKTGNRAGVWLGDEPWIGTGLGWLAPVVILSACHVSPRGVGTVSIVDMLLREGTFAVLGTQVPVGVVHNTTLMARFFTYIGEVLLGREDHGTLLEVWHRVQSSNAVVDVLNGSDTLRRWGFETLAASGEPVVKEFMGGRAAGVLRQGHVYADTEDVLESIANEQGMGAKVRGWFRSPGYVPESLFYFFSGVPDRIVLGSRTRASCRAGHSVSGIRGRNGDGGEG